MISSKKLIRMARKWQKMNAMGKKIISSPNTFVANKGHFVVYSSDQIRLVIPLAYLHNTIFRELFKMSEEEFGLPRDGPITLSCDAVFIEYILSLIRRGLARDLEQALLFSIGSNRCYLPFVQQQETGKQVACS